MADLQKQIEELEKEWRQADLKMSEQWETKDALQKALSIIKQLQEEIKQLKGENNDK